jgi:hypothetical protein
MDVNPGGDGTTVNVSGLLFPPLVVTVTSLGPTKPFVPTAKGTVIFVALTTFTGPTVIA